MSFLDPFDVILLDMNGTFMFGHDRFGPEQDYYATYLANGGTRLDRATVTTTMECVVRELFRMYRDPAHYDDFPSVAEMFTNCAGMLVNDLPALCATFAEHELGVVPVAHAALLQQLSRSHQLGVVSNLWSDPARCRAHLNDVGLESAFMCTVFSSERRSIKPSLRLFHQAIAAVPNAQRILFVGDSWDRDIVPAKQLGWATAWISDAGAGDADCVIPSLLALPAVGA